MTTIQLNTVHNEHGSLHSFDVFVKIADTGRGQAHFLFVDRFPATTLIKTINQVCTEFLVRDSTKKAADEFLNAIEKVTRETDSHNMTTHYADESENFIVNVCTCGWRSSVTHIASTEGKTKRDLEWERHIVTYFEPYGYVTGAEHV
jgi:hypothetical protein